MKKELMKNLKRFGLLMLIGIIVLTAIALIGAAQITITPENNTEEYPNLIVKNGANILANFSLIENSKNCAVDCYAVINITSYLSAALPNSFDFKDSKSNARSLPFDTYFYNYTKYNITTLNYDNNCTNFTYYNVTLSQNMTGTNCTKKNTSNSTKTYVFGWQTYQGQTFQAGNHTIKIVGHKNMNDAIDWGFSYQGILGDEIRQYWAWWNASWNYMKPITNITSDFVILYIPIASGKMNSDFSDLRFTDTLNTSELGYWIESYNATQATIRVNMNKNISLNMWYGNAAATTKSNIQSVYLNSVVDFWNMNNGTSNYLKLTNSSGGGNINYSDGGRFGKFLDISSSGYLEYADNAAWDFTNTGNFTMLTYIKKSGTTDSGIISRGTSSPEMLWYTQGVNGVIYILDGDQNTATTGSGVGTLLGVNTWQLLGITQNGPSNWTWWMNGTIVLSEGITMTYDNTNAVMHIGRAASRYLAGGMDDILLLNKSLTPVEMKAIYNTSDVGYIIGSEQANAPNPYPVTINWTSQTPTDISTINVLNNIANISYNYTNGSSDYFNWSTVRLYTKVNTSTSDCSGFFNGTAKCGYTGWGFKTSTGNISSIYYFSLDDNEIYPAVYNYPDHLYMETTSKLDFNISNQNSAARSNFINMSNTTLYNVLEVNIRNMTSTSAAAQAWYCNSSYVSGSVSSNANCVQIATITASTLANHTHGSNSQHYVIPFSIINGKVSNTTYVTQDNAFIIRGNTGGWNIRYIANKTRTNAAQTTTTTFGGSWAELTGTFDMHFHQYSGTESLWYFATAQNSSNIWINSSEKDDLLNLGGLVPSAPSVYNPIATTYSGNITINYTASISPNGYPIMYYNISLYNNDTTFNRTLVSNNSLNLSYVWLVNGNNTILANGDYHIGVVGVDNLSQTSVLGLSEKFTYLVIPPNDIPQYSSLSVSPESPTNFDPNGIYVFTSTWIDIGGNSTPTVLLNFNGVNYTATNVSTTYTYQLANLSAGTYNYYWIAIDQGNNSNMTSSTSYTINKISSGVSISASPSDTNDYGTATNVTGSGCPSQLTCTLTRDGNVVSNNDYQTFKAGTYVYNYSSNSNENYTASSATLTLTINKATPSLAISILPSTTVSNGTATNVTASGCAVSCTLTRNGTTISNPDIQTLNVGIYTYNYSDIGNENYSAYSIKSILTITPTSGTSGSVSFVNNNLSSIINFRVPFNFTTIGYMNLSGTRVLAQRGLYDYISFNLNYSTDILHIDKSYNNGSILSGGAYGNYTYFSGSIPNYTWYPSNIWISGDINTTINFWVNFSSSIKNQGLFSFDNGASDFMKIYTDADVLSVYLKNSTTLNSVIFTRNISGIIDTNVWHMITLTKNLYNYTIYIDGVEYNSTISSGNYLRLANYTFMIGSEGLARRLNGGLDEIGLYRTTLNITQIQTLNSTKYPIGDVTNLNVSLNGTQIFFYPLVFNMSNNRTTNFYTTMNKYLKTCSYVSGVCNVPINFSSTDEGLLNYTDVLIDNYGFIENSKTYNANTIETLRENYTFNMSYDSSAYSLSAWLVYNNTEYLASSTINGYEAILNRTLVLPTGNGTKTHYWKIGLTNASGTYFFNSTFANQSVNSLNMSLCKAAPLNVPFLNYTFHNETLAGEAITATFTATFNYWLSDPSSNKTYTFTNATVNPNYLFCFTPASVGLFVAATGSYTNSFSQGRNFENSSMYLTNTTTIKDLLLLPNSDGIYVTFSVRNNFGSALSGVLVEIRKTSGNVPVEQKYTDGTGAAAFWLSTTTAYTVTATKSGYDAYSTSLTPTTTAPIPIVLTQTSSSGSGASSVTSPTKIPLISISPSKQTLENDTPTTFTFDISYEDTLDRYGFTIYNQTDELATRSGTLPGGEILQVDIDTAKNNYLIMRYYYVIDGIYYNRSKTWVVESSDGSDFSILHAVGTFDKYTNENSTGLFGIKRGTGNGNFTFAVVIFLITLFAAGSMTYKFGITSETAVMFTIFSIILFFDVGAGWIPNPLGQAIPHFVTWLVAVITIGFFVRETL